MNNIRISRARKTYKCDICSKNIHKNQIYYREEPSPQARYYRGEKVKFICFSCIHKQEYDHKFACNLYYGEVKQNIDEIAYEQLTLDFQNPIKIVKAKIIITDISPQIIEWLRNDLDKIYNLSPEAFEQLICNILMRMGFDVKRVGRNSFQKDGGIDIIAWPQKIAFPPLLAIQAKHHKSPRYKTGPSPVRDLLGVVKSNFGFNAGVLITNTTFTPDAEWFAQENKTLLRLRDIEDIKKWLEDDYLDEYNLREMPNSIKVCPGLTLDLTKRFR